MWNKVEYNKVDDSGRGHLEMVREVTLEENQPYTIIDVANPSPWRHHIKIIPFPNLLGFDVTAKRRTNR